MKVYVLKNPRSQIPVAIFSDPDPAKEMLERIFVDYDYPKDNCIEVFELDPLKELTNNGIYPWAVKVDVIDNEAFVESLGSLELLFDKEKLSYEKGGKYAIAHVFAPDAERAEARALELWDIRKQEGGYVKSGSIYTVSFGSNGDIMNVDKKTTFYYDDELSADEISQNSRFVSVEVMTDDIAVAIDRAKKMYDAWINKEAEAWDV